MTKRERQKLCRATYREPKRRAKWCGNCAEYAMWIFTNECPSCSLKLEGRWQSDKSVYCEPRGTCDAWRKEG